MASCMILLALLSFSGVYVCIATHFRGAIIVWQPTGNSNQIEINYRQSWRRSFSEWSYCDQDTIDDGTVLGAGYLTCPTCPTTNVCPFTFQCTDFSVGEDWTTGVGTCVHNIQLTSFVIQYTGCCWITSLNNVYGSGDWSIEAWINFAPRPDNGAINSSPITNMQPIIRTKYGCPYLIRIPTSDADEDDVRCRWPSTLSESGELTLPPLNMKLDEHACTLQFDATSLGWWGVAVIIEDFVAPSSNTPLSKIPLQFLVEVAPNTNPCETAYEPVLVDPSPKDGQCVGLPLGETYIAEIRAKNNAPGENITEIDTVSPLGMKKSPVRQVPDFDDEYYVTVDWTPTHSQQGPNIFCFAAVDGLGQSSEQRCITILVGTSGPTIDMDNVQPLSGSEVPEHQYSWKLVFNEEFILANDTAYIKFFDAHGHPVFYVDVATSPYVYPNYKTLTFYTNGLNLKPGNDYYILVDEGVVMGKGNCRPESPGLSIPWEWAFSVEQPEEVTWSDTTIDATDDDRTIVPTEAPLVPVRLVGGKDDREGRVEVFFAGQWGTVCDDGFKSEEAHVVCRQLGYSDANITAHCCSRFGQGSGIIWMDDLGCDGSERDLGQCIHRGWGEHNCDHSEDASVMCARPNGQSAVVDCSGRMLTVYIPRDVIGDNEAEHIHFIDDSCVGAHHNNTHVRISTSFNQCGTSMEVRGDYVVFSNIVIDEALAVTPDKIITRDRHIEIPVECRMERDGLSSISFNPDSSKIVFREEGYGVFSFNLSLYEDQTYHTPFPRDAYPIDVELRDMLYFEGRVSAEPGLELFVETCMATTDTDPSSHPQYSFIDDGCSKDKTLQHFHSSDPMIRRFGLEAFAFVGIHTPVYVHCYLMLCNISDYNSRCSQGCLNPINKREIRTAYSGSKSYVMTQGPISMHDSQHSASFDTKDDQSDVVYNEFGLLIGTVAFATLCLTITLGVLLTNRRKTMGYVAVDTMGDDE